MLFKSARERINKFTDVFLKNHPVLGLIAVFVGLPAVILASVAVSSTVFTLPIAFLMGWI